MRSGLIVSRLAALVFSAALLASPAAAQNDGWTDYGGGTLLRRNAAVTQALSGYNWVYLSSYNGGSGGGMASKYVATFCGGLNVHIYTESSVSMNGGGAFGNSARQEEDAGQYEVLEDKAGNTFLHMVLQKNGNKFMHFRLEGVKIYAEQNLTFTRYQRVC